MEFLDNTGSFASVKHARYIDSDTVYHVLCKTLQGFFLLRPDRHGELKELVAGVIGRAQWLYPEVQLYAGAFLSNHFHMMMQGPAQQSVAFVAYVKREISRRWGPKIDWHGPMWQRYQHTALPTAESQVACLEYILSQSVKEHLVARPEQWPGFHCARALRNERRSPGRWFDATAYGKAMFREGLKARPRTLDRTDYTHEYDVHFAKIPAWRDCSDAEYASRAGLLIDDVVEKAQAARTKTGRRVVGVKGVCRMPRTQRRRFQPAPWFVVRRRMIAWANRRAPEVRAYLRRYWQFQHAFRDASRRLLAGELAADFPPGAFRPSIPQPVLELMP